MENLTVKHSTKADLLAALRKLTETVALPEGYVPLVDKSSKQVIFDEIEKLKFLSPKDPPADENKEEILKEKVQEVDPLGKMEKPVRSALGNLIEAVDFFNGFIDKKKEADRDDRYIHEAIASAENAIHRLHVREGHKAKFAKKA